MILQYYLSLVQTEEDAKKVEFIYNSFYSAMLYSANSILNNKNDAEDAVHDAMVKIIEILDIVDFSSTQKLKTFCCIVAKNKAKDMVKRKSNSNVELNESLAYNTNEKATPEDIVLNKELFTAIENELDSLSDTYKDVCMLRFVYEMREKDIAKLLNLSEKNVSSRVRRGKEIIREKLKGAV